MGPLGVQETVFIFVLALLVFGPRKLPELGRTIGKAMSEFKRHSSDLRATFDREMNQIERENESLKDITRQYAYDEHSNNHDSYYDNGEYHSGTYDYNTADQTSVSASAPQGADEQVDHSQTAIAGHVGETAGETPVETNGNSSAEPSKVALVQPAGADDPHSVKS